MKYTLFLLCLHLLFSLGVSAKKKAKTVSFRYYGSTWFVRFPDNLHIQWNDTSTVSLADELGKESYIQDIIEATDECMRLKQEKRLNDWAYLNMLDSLTITRYGRGNEATLVKSSIFINSGYKMRLARDNNYQLYMLFSSTHYIYGLSYFTIDGEWYYIHGNFNIKTAHIINSNPKDKRQVSLDMKEPPLLDYKPTVSKTWETGKALHLSICEKVTPLKLSVKLNQNLLDFYAQYPSSMKNYDFMTRWAMMANIALDGNLKQQIYPNLKEQLKGLSQKDAVQSILTFMHTAFEYADDEDIWGYDRAFYSEETLFYSKSDVEDRVILMSRFVRDLLDLPVILMFFPGHLALGIHFDEEVEGANIIYNGDRFVFCDAVYLGSSIGQLMSLYADEDPERIILLYK